MTFTTRLVGVAMICAVSATALGASTGTAVAGVGTAAPVAPATVAGTYKVTVDWLGAGHGTLRIVLNADGTGKLKHFGNAIAWTLNGTAFQMVIAGGDPATFDGITTTRGFNTKRHPGAMSNLAGDSGTWYARPV